MCKSKERFLKHMRSRKFSWKKPSCAWKNQFCPIFLVLPVMLLKTKLFEKELFCASFFVLCSIKNLCEQFITAHIVSWHFFCIIKLHFVRTYEADEDFLYKQCYLPDDFDLFSFVLVSIATSGSSSIGPKEIQTNVMQVTRSILQQLSECWKQNVSKKSYLSSEKETLLHFFLVIPSFADVHNSFITLQKVFKQIWCK